MREHQQLSQKWLMIVFGLPASGKSTLCQRLSKQASQKTIVLSGDMFELTLKKYQNFHLELQNLESSQLLAKIQQIYLEFNQGKAEFYSQKWKQSRQLLQMITKKLLRHVNIILDDDFLLISQRRTYQKISWERNIKYLEVYVNVSVEKCIQNQQKRKIQKNDTVVSPQVIKKANEKLQISQKQSLYLVKIFPEDEILLSELISKMSYVKILKNDPNDIHDPKHKQKKLNYEHSQKQLFQISIRNFVGSIMKMKNQQLFSNFGSEIVESKKIQDKKILSFLLNKWKKSMTNSPIKNSSNEYLLQNLISFLKTL